MSDFQKLEKNSDSPQSSSEKYYVSCDTILQNLTTISNIDVNQDRALLRAIKKNKHVVVKIGESATIRKEYDIGKRLSSIKGFIKYICETKCHDNIQKYLKLSSNSKLCTDDIHDPIVNILVMPFIRLGSMRTYQWNDTNIDVFKSCIKQLICSLAYAFEHYGFLHTDIHLGNVLIKPCNKSEIGYENFNIKTYGKQICIMDFELSFINVDAKETTMFYKDIKRVFDDITYTLKMNFNGFQELDEFVLKRIYSKHKPPLRDVFKILPIIDGLVYNGKIQPMQYKEYVA